MYPQPHRPGELLTARRGACYPAHRCSRPISSTSAALERGRWHTPAAWLDQSRVLTRGRAMFRDPILLALAERHPAPDWRDRSEYLFEDLIGTIISQQLSLKAAATILRRFRQCCDAWHTAQSEDQPVSQPLLASLPTETQPFPTPHQILALPDDHVRAAGLSGAKTRAIRHVATAFASGQISGAMIKDLPDAAAIETLIQLKGIGTWSAEMI